MKTIAALEAWLGELHQRTRETPLFNPVFQLSLVLSRALEGVEISLDDMGALVTALECEGLKARAGKLRRLLAPSATAAPLAGDEDDFEAFRARWERPQLHAVFTAHPTFLLTEAQAEAACALPIIHLQGGRITNYCPWKSNDPRFPQDAPARS
jgi:phosphoenolpyruvate carboxylase